MKAIATATVIAALTLGLQGCSTAYNVAKYSNDVDHENGSGYSIDDGWLEINYKMYQFYPDIPELKRECMKAARQIVKENNFKVDLEYTTTNDLWGGSYCSAFGELK